MQVQAIIVLPDGTTWNTVEGCSIKVITRENFEALIEDKIDAGDIPAIVEINLADISPD